MNDLAWYVRPAARAWTCAPVPADAREVRAFHAGLPGYAPTPLVEVPAIATQLGVGRVFVKDESARMGLAAFKVLGASWATHQVLSRRPPGTPTLLVAATDGNHGRAVARMARINRHRALVFVPDGVHPAVLDAIEAEGAQVTQVPGSYDDAVRAAAEAASDHERAVLVQDTGWPGYEQIPSWIVEGYSTLFAEVDAQLSDAGVPGAALVVVPTGVGSLAQAAVAHHRGRSGARPALMSVEPVTAAGVLASLTEKRLVSVATGHTVMAGLNCGTPSALAWPYLRDGLDAACAVTDSASVAAARELAGYGISAGPCGAAALAGIRTALTGQEAGSRRVALALRPGAAVVLLNTEGAAANPLPAPIP